MLAGGAVCRPPAAFSARGRSVAHYLQHIQCGVDGELRQILVDRLGRQERAGSDPRPARRRPHRRHVFIRPALRRTEPVHINQRAGTQATGSAHGPQDGSAHRTFPERDGVTKSEPPLVRDQQNDGHGADRGDHSNPRVWRDPTGLIRTDSVRSVPRISATGSRGCLSAAECTNASGCISHRWRSRRSCIISCATSSGRCGQVIDAEGAEVPAGDSTPGRAVLHQSPTPISRSVSRSARSA
jgi:hypothetical protein